MNRKRHVVFQGQPTNANEKKLMTLIYESKELEKEVRKQDSNLQNIPNVDDNILEIQFREQLDREIEQYDQTIQFLKAESEKVKINLAEYCILIRSLKNGYANDV